MMYYVLVHKLKMKNHFCYRFLSQYNFINSILPYSPTAWKTQCDYKQIGITGGDLLWGRIYPFVVYNLLFFAFIVLLCQLYLRKQSKKQQRSCARFYWTDLTNIVTSNKPSFGLMLAIDSALKSFVTFSQSNRNFFDGPFLVIPLILLQTTEFPTNAWNFVGHTKPSCLFEE